MRTPQQQAIYIRRRVVAAALVVALALGVFIAGSQLATLMGGASAEAQMSLGAARPSAQPGEPSDRTVLTQTDRIGGKITPKSVVSSGHGLVIANNMMYSHSMTVYDARTRALKATISDAVVLSAFGIGGHAGTSKGSPVEAAFTADGRYAYVSNYSMYGSGFGPHGVDTCKPTDGYDASYLYRVDTKSMKIDQVIPVGAVPKYVAITPDQRKVLVTNWCDYTMSIIDRVTTKTLSTVKIGPMPRGVVISPDSRTAFVTAMWTSNVYRVDLANPPKQAPVLASPGERMRHLDISPDGKFLYAVSTGSDSVSKIEAGSGKIIAKVKTEREPRSMAISADGKALYVVNYLASTMTKVRTSDMTALQTVKTEHHPIGITYEPTTHAVWVANYGGSIQVFDDSKTA